MQRMKIFFQYKKKRMIGIKGIIIKLAFLSVTHNDLQSNLCISFRFCRYWLRPFIYNDVSCDNSVWLFIMSKSKLSLPIYRHAVSHFLTKRNSMYYLVSDNNVYDVIQYCSCYLISIVDRK